HILDYQDDPSSSPGSAGTQLRVLNVEANITYDVMGDKTGSVDANGLQTALGYDAMGRHTFTGVTNYDGLNHNFHIENDTLDALGNIKVKRTANEELVVNNSYDEIGRLIKTVEDPTGAQPRTTTLALDGLGNVLSRKVTDKTNAIVAQTDDTYDRLNHV